MIKGIWGFTGGYEALLMGLSSAQSKRNLPGFFLAICLYLYL